LRGGETEEEGKIGAGGEEKRPRWIGREKFSFWVDCDGVEQEITVTPGKENGKKPRGEGIKTQQGDGKERVLGPSKKSVGMESKYQGPQKNILTTGERTIDLPWGE